MKQSKLMSWVETCLNTGIGFAIAIATQLLVFPLFDYDPPLSTNFKIALIFTVVSIVRGYVVRRLFEALHIRVPMSSFATAALRERVRQQTDEGYSLSDDDGLPPGDLALAGACYAEAAGAPVGRAPIDWPWKDELWKPAGFRKDLVKACALIIAEGEKFDRSSKQKRRSF